MTTSAKKVGGPVNFLILVGSGGAALYKVCETGVKHCVKRFKASRRKNIKSNNTIYIITSLVENNMGTPFELGGQFRVLVIDDGVALIEIIGDENNPYVVSTEELKKISNYR